MNYYYYIIISTLGPDLWSW